ncbi:BT_3987 domain-containing protein [Mucilaginibacter sp.]
MNKYIKLSFAMILTAVSLSSCLKDKPVLEEGNTPTVVEFGDLDNNTNGVAEYANADYKYNLYRKSFDIKSTPTTFSIPIKYSGGQPAPADITVTVQVNNDIIAGYNTYRGYTDVSEPEYVLPLPTANYTVPSYTVVIPKGQTYGLFNVNLNTNLFTFTNQFALGFSIKSASNNASVSGNFGTCLYNISAKNQYDGNYTANGSIAFPPPTAGRSWANRGKTLTTADVNTSETEAADLGGSGYIMRLRVNADNSVTVTPAPSSVNKTIQNSGRCVYDPATKTFTLNYKYVGGTGDRVISETIKKN